jgi:orotidine-5'-phosphate decarboxylase
MGDSNAKSRIALALDVPDLDAAKHLIEQTHASIGVFKVGLELFTAEGPSAVRAVHDAGADCFLDLKLHDIPATMGRSVERASAMGVAFLTVHAAAGSESLRAASERAGATDLLAVTVLTSLDSAALRAIGLRGDPKTAADRLARLAWDSGVRGFVTSPLESAELRTALGPDAFIVTPGIRPAGAVVGDQKRVTTPAEAIRTGANLLVIGRPIRDATDPSEAARAVLEQVEAALVP